MYYLNKIVGGILNPMGIGILLLLIAIVLGFAASRRRARGESAGWRGVGARWVPVAAAVWLWVWSCGITGRLVGLPLERAYPPTRAEDLPEADAIVVLGGGVSRNTNACVYAEIQSAADRAWHAARLWKAGKARRIFVTNDMDTELMADLGVSREALLPPTQARNTEEEARRVGEILTSEKRGDADRTKPPRLLLVTSAWHMRRAKLMFDRYVGDVEVIAAPADYESTSLFGGGIKFSDFLPDCEMVCHNAYRFKECLGYFGYRWLRR